VLTNGTHQAKKTTVLQVVVSVLFIFYLFLLSLEMLGGAFRLIGQQFAQDILSATSNPFIGLFIGLLFTAIVQSSSLTTSITVAMVAAGTLALENAIPIIMGANVGTTVTCSLVTLAHIAAKTEYRKAVAAATVHNIFNLFVAIILFPLEYFTGFLSYLSKQLTSIFFPANLWSPSNWSLIGKFVKPLSEQITNFMQFDIFWLLLLAIALLFASLQAFTLLFRLVLIGDSLKALDKYIFGSQLKSLFSGLFLTAGIQSSSVTTSLLVPLVATNKVSMKNAFPFVMGANIGTTITALIAAVTKSDTAVSLALAHVLFNLIGVIIIYPVPFVRNIPIWLAQRVGALTMKWRIAGFIYLVLMFFVIPFLLIYINMR
jgi:sodium-dependent phosphate cotransporter